MPKFVGCMRIRNEARWIKECIEAQLPLCETIFILDDHSTDQTVELCQSFGERVRVFPSPFPDTLDEARDKTWILERALESNPDWVLILDGDEILEREGPKKLQWYAGQDCDVISCRVLYYWNDVSTLRVDRIYKAFFRPSAFRVIDKDLKWEPHARDYAKGNLHCGSIPSKLKTAPQAIADVALWHYSAIDPQKRWNSYLWYNQADPQNHNEDQYRHAVQGDPGGPAAWEVLKHAGPLELVSVTEFLAVESQLGRSYSRRPSEYTVPANRKPVARSFDLFDTILARRCVGTPRAACGAKSLEQELKADQENLFAIAEMVSQVKPDDIIVTDTIYPQDFLEKTVRRLTGLKNTIIATPEGKLTGEVWSTIFERYEVTDHSGDNFVSDVLNPGKHGIRTSHVRVSTPTASEQLLCDAGFVGLSRVMREARLATYDSDPDIRALQHLQTQINIPVLFLASNLLNLTYSIDPRRILMSSRDCFLWSIMMNAVREITDDDYTVEYFYTSRIPRVFPSENYLKYVKHCLDAPAVLVDLTGTGWSLGILAEKAGFPDIPIVLLSRYADANIDAEYESIHRPNPKANVTSMVVERSTVIEKANMADHAMVMDVNEKFEPIFYNPTNTDFASVPEIRIQHNVFRYAMSLFDKNDFSIDLKVDRETTKRVLETCHFHYEDCEGPARKFADGFFNEEDRRLWGLLKAMSRGVQV